MNFQKEIKKLELKKESLESYSSDINKIKEKLNELIEDYEEVKSYIRFNTNG